MYQFSIRYNNTILLNYFYKYFLHKVRFILRIYVMMMTMSKCLLYICDDDDDDHEQVLNVGDKVKWRWKTSSKARYMR